MPDRLRYPIHGRYLISLSSRTEVLFIATCRCVGGIPRPAKSGCCSAYTGVDTGVDCQWNLVLLPFDCVVSAVGVIISLAELGAVGSSDATDHCHEWVSLSSECLQRLLYLVFFLCFFFPFSFILRKTQWPVKKKKQACTFREGILI